MHGEHFLLLGMSDPHYASSNSAQGRLILEQRAQELVFELTGNGRCRECDNHRFPRSGLGTRNSAGHVLMASGCQEEEDI